MLIDDILKKEIVEMFEDIFDKKEQADAIKKAAAGDMKAWAESHKIDPKTVTAVYGQYSAWRKGKIKWGEEVDEDEDYTTLLISVMDEAAGIER
jgi:hypothetical protein